MDAATTLQIRGVDHSWYSLADRGDGTAAVQCLVVVDDVNATGIQSMIDVYGGQIPGAVVVGTLPGSDGGDPLVYSANHQALVWTPSDDGAGGALQTAAVGFLEQGTLTSPQPRWVLSDAERVLVGLPLLP